MQKRKAVLASAVLTILLVSFYCPVSANTAGIKVMVNNQLLSANIQPQNLNGVLMVPAKEFIQALGGTFTTDRAGLTSTISLGENEAIFRLDNSIVKHNGKNVQAPAPMAILGYRYMIPAEFTARCLGAESYMHTYKNTLMVFQPSDGKLVYRVTSGDTLWILSNVFGTTISSLKQLNSLSVDTLYIGQPLIIKEFSSAGTVISAQASNNATVFRGPGFGFSTAGYIKAWTAISIVGKTGEWFKVITPAGNGYTHQSVTSIKQDIIDTSPNSSYFEKKIAVDTSKKYITYSNYTVQRGDSIWTISQKVGVLDYELAQANNISTSATLYVGQVLKVPVHNIPPKDKLGESYGEILDWFEEGQYVFPIGKNAKLTDLETGKSFNVRRTMGANHADCEVPTLQDAQIMKDIFGGTWSWNRRPFILELDGRRFAVSVAGMPHAGVDGAPYLQNVSNRSDNWGYGPNYDSIPGNGMDGHFDVYFLNGLRHKDNLIDSQHQYRVLMAGGMQ
ncbi:MAG: LysM peptidoglycan-binding domain-containing protein [Clostridia bacterium]|nr:LysM peptidoglycan-binding domain-containing protein [Clostridia bacterium]